MTTMATFDTTALRTAIETRDADGQLAGYAPNAELTIVDRDHQPSQPTVLRGSEQIGDYLRDVCARDMTHKVADLVVGSDRIAFLQHCHYADGTRVLCSTVAEIADGLITRQTAVQAWDA